MGGPTIHTRQAEKICELLRPGMGMGMGMEGRGSPIPVVEIDLVTELDELIVTEGGEQMISQ